MKTRLPEPLANYYAAVNARDNERVLGLFAEDAVVKDEGNEHRGHDAIRSWMHETTRKYGRDDPASSSTSRQFSAVSRCSMRPWRTRPPKRR